MCAKWSLSSDANSAFVFPRLPPQLRNVLFSKELDVHLAAVGFHLNYDKLSLLLIILLLPVIYLFFGQMCPSGDLFFFFQATLNMAIAVLTLTCWKCPVEVCFSLLLC